LAERIREINELQEAGMISGPLADKAIARAKQESGGANTSRANTDLTARTAGDIDTYAAARRNLGDSGQKTQIDIAKKQLKIQSETKKLLASQKPQVFTLSGVS
jgi:hypothetical protein